MAFCSAHEDWLYRLEANYSWQSGLPIGKDQAFRDKKGKIRLILERGGRITVTRHYSWDGCSPKFCLFDLVIGTPDGVTDPKTGKPKTYYASLVHDALYQFLSDGLPLEKAQADRCFLALTTETRFRLRHLYFGAVWLLGGLHRRIVRRWRQLLGERVEL